MPHPNKQVLFADYFGNVNAVCDLTIAYFIVDNYGPTGYDDFSRDFVGYYDTATVRERAKVRSSLSRMQFDQDFVHYIHNCIDICMD